MSGFVRIRMKVKWKIFSTFNCVVRVGLRRDGDGEVDE